MPGQVGPRLGGVPLSFHGEKICIKYAYVKEGFDLVEGSNIAACHILRMIMCTELNSYRRNRGTFGDLSPPGRGSCELLAFVRDGLQFFLVELEHCGSLSGGAVILPRVDLRFAHNARTRTNILFFDRGRRRIAAIFLDLGHRHAGLHDLAAATQRILGV